MIRVHPPLQRWFWLALLASASVGCGAQALVKSAEKEVAKKHVLVRLSAGTDSNQARPVYYMIRAVGDESGFAEGYDAALTRALAEPVDASVLARGLVRPHESLDLALTPKEDVDLGVYVFFTARDSTFKLRIPKPVPKLLALHIDRSTIRDQTSESKR